MGYVYARRLCCEENDMIRALRSELYLQPYEEIDWPKQRNNVHPVDLYSAHSRLLDVLHVGLAGYEKVIGSWGWLKSLREKAVARVWELIKLEDDNTKFIGIGPVSRTRFPHLLLKRAFYRFQRLSTCWFLGTWRDQSRPASEVT